MRLISRDATLPPGMCFICTAAPSEGQGLVDTEHNFEPPFPDNRTGRIYVCEGCASGISNAVGFVSAASKDESDVRANEAEWRLRAALDYFNEVASKLDEAVTEAGHKAVSDQTPAPASEGKSIGEAVAEQSTVEPDTTPDTPAASPEPSPEQVDAEKQASEGQSVTTKTTKGGQSAGIEGGQ